MFFKPQAREEEGKKRKSPGMAKPSSSLQGSLSSRGLYFRGLPFFIMSALFLVATGLIFFAVEISTLFGSFTTRFMQALAKED